MKERRNGRGGEEEGIGTWYIRVSGLRISGLRVSGQSISGSRDSGYRDSGYRDRVSGLPLCSPDLFDDVDACKCKSNDYVDIIVGEVPFKVMHGLRHVSTVTN